jgi:streptogramin lyase
MRDVIIGGGESGEGGGSAIPSPDGTVWFTEARLGKIGHLIPLTKEITEYQNSLPDGRPAGSHTIRVDQSGHVWTSGGPVISRFDVATKEFTHFDAAGSYGNVVMVVSGSASETGATSAASIPKPKRSRNFSCPDPAQAPTPSTTSSAT